MESQLQGRNYLVHQQPQGFINIRSELGKHQLVESLRLGDTSNLNHTLQAVLGLASDKNSIDHIVGHQGIETFR